MTVPAASKKSAPRSGGAPVLAQTLGARSASSVARPASDRVDLDQSAGRNLIKFLAAAAVVIAVAGCDTVRFKATGTEKHVDWGVDIRF